MGTDSDHTPTPNGLKERIGFWGGLVLFALALCVPQQAGMVAAARHAVTVEARSEIGRLLRQRGISTKSPEYTETLERELDARQPHIEAEAARRAARMPRAAAVTLLVAVWWMTVALPIPATSLLPLLLFPLLGVLPVREVAIPYANHYIFLFLGGFIIALGIERWGLHRRIALHLIRRIGTSRRRLVFAFLLATAVLSMWISNTATTLMMLPIGLAVIGSIDEVSTKGRGRAGDTPFGAALMLGICYGASIGGLATPIGTPPNLAFQGQWNELFSDAPAISFAKWILCFGPLTAVFLPVAWWLLTRVTCRVPPGSDPAHHRTLVDALHKLPRITGPERWMLAMFGAAAVLWMTRDSIRFDLVQITGWQQGLSRWAPAWFPLGYMNDTTVALGIAALLFVIPGGRDKENRRVPLMDWETAVRLPWGTLLLFGGGFAIAHAFRHTGLSGWTGHLLAGTGLEHPLAWVVACSGLLTFLTEITSNTATTQVMLPVLAQTATQIQINPLVLMLPATISASCAFMLPVATPPNAIVFASGQISMGRMVRSGIVLNFVGIALVTTVFYVWVTWLLGIDPHVLPAWTGGG